MTFNFNESKVFLEAVKSHQGEEIGLKNTYPSGRKNSRPKSEGGKLSEKEARAELAKAESLYVLGINSAYVEQARKAVEAKFGRSPADVSVGEPAFSPALCVKMSVPCHPTRLSDIRMQFFMA